MPVPTPKWRMMNFHSMLRSTSTSSFALVLAAAVTLLALSGIADAVKIRGQRADDTLVESAVRKLLEDRVQLIYAQIQVGDPPQNFTVTFDTGSSELLLPGAKCSSGSCVSHQRYDVQASTTGRELFKKGTQTRVFGLHAKVDAAVMKDKVCVGTWCAPSAQFLSARDMSDELFDQLPYDGILGLGLSSESFGMGMKEGVVDPATLPSSLKKDQSLNLFQNFVESKALKNNQFALWFRSAVDPPGEKSGITFGSHDPNRMASKMYWFPVPYPANHWALPISDFVMAHQSDMSTALTEEPLKLCEPAPKKCTVLFDSASPLMILSRPVFERVKEAIATGYPRKPVSDAELADCQPLQMKMPKIGISFRGVTFYLDPEDYVDKTGNICLYRFQVMEGDQNLIYLGRPWLEKYYTVFDRDSLKIGLALSKHARTVEISDAISDEEVTTTSTTTTTTTTLELEEVVAAEATPAAVGNPTEATSATVNLLTGS
ncbi:unnamed protein product [Amoebophrya sp. A25]|nr:unnamed protein product [Amoebophrya sp. A25]|eukprot:GSA25T00019293001.1